MSITSTNQSMSVPLSLGTMLTKPTRGRPRLPTPERIENKKATQKAWVQRNYEYVTAQCKRLSTRPEYQERRKVLYAGKRQALLDSGFVPRPRGRPRLYEAEGSHTVLAGPGTGCVHRAAPLN